MSAYSIATRGLAGRKVPQGVLATMDDLLFSGSEQGAWYDPSDMSALFQDSAGTTPVTAVEQPVGRILDKSGRGNHATQATTTKRPVYSRRVNLLTKTEDFSDAVWVKNSATVQRLADISGMAVYKIIGNVDALPKSVEQSNFAPAGSQIYMSAIVKAAGCNSAYIAIGASRATAIFNLVTGQVASAFANGTNYSNPIASITPVGDGEFKITFAVTAVSDVGSRRFGPAMGVNVEYTGDGVSGIAIRAATLLVGIVDAHLPYQYVNTATDYDADPAKYPAYLRFDGVDDVLQTGNIDFTGTDKMTVWAGVTKLSDAAYGAIVELSESTDAQPAGFAFFASNNPGFYLQTGAPSDRTYGTITTPASPYSAVLSAKFDRALSTADESQLRVNGGSAISVPVLDGLSATGSFGNYPLYIGARAGTSFYFNGRLGCLIIRGAQSNLSQIEATELYVKQKMRLP